MNETRFSSRLAKTRNLVLQLAIGAVVGCGAFAVMTPIARWTCEASARRVCANGDTTQVDFHGVAGWSSCAVRCVGAPGAE